MTTRRGIFGRAIAGLVALSARGKAAPLRHRAGMREMTPEQVEMFCRRRFVPERGVLLMKSRQFGFSEAQRLAMAEARGANNRLFSGALWHDATANREAARVVHFYSADP